MANQDASFGLKPVRMMGGSPYTGGQSRYRIANNYGTSIFQGDMVMQVTGGGVEIHADGGTVPIVGVLTDVLIQIQQLTSQYLVIFILLAPLLQI